MSVYSRVVTLMNGGHLTEGMILRAVRMGLLRKDEIPVEFQAKATNAESIRAQAQTALTANRTYLALASPTAAQNTAQVKALTRQNQGLIRLLLEQLDGTD